MPRVGYARVSSTGQSLEVQLEKLSQVKCDRIYQEKRSGRIARPSWISSVHELSTRRRYLDYHAIGSAGSFGTACQAIPAEEHKKVGAN